jgi:Meiotically up-regulated gene 113
MPKNQSQTVLGYVYLMKSGKFYKLGRSNAAGRREYELGIQLPEKLKTVHVIRTDDPAGIEAYWHQRFEAKRKNGEWFDLNAMDIAAFQETQIYVGGQRMSPECLHTLADWSSILTFVVTCIGATVGVFGYIKYLCGCHWKSKRLEEYLRAEKTKQVDQGQRSIIQIIREVGLTEDEIIQVSFRNPHGGRRAKLGEDALAKQLLFEYQE